MNAIIELQNVGKKYGAFDALRDINLSVTPGEVTCVLGDNGAGKSTLIKILSGLHGHTSGTMLVDATPTHFTSPADALAAGIATVYQDLAVVGQMSVWRNFFLGQEITNRWGMINEKKMKSIAAEELGRMGIVIPDIDAPVASLSGGQRQVVAIARAIYFGARVVILDEPTAALGVKQSGMVLRFIAKAREQGTAVIFITHNPKHALLVGDRFVVLTLGRQTLQADREDVDVDTLTLEMSGGAELDALQHELQR
ncbi:Ribose import ATP-binding protein RbsA [Corynebacterium ciconiae DSM 44920]|uniref:ATP-binding cassette domain-containing protein n=1 Tax=Corynebacterium ciconiae TaxID=227319 RepID=UPI00036A206F|nr:ATP-binding cassette domain-containing protein [Corynebacterium ciconiae]WKD60385.1 Ribose import ATP-binding protein RbsA [Corynebacterium ciconiae DSM 44920]